jgi:hypothetical protein
MAKSKPQVISDRTWAGQQSWNRQVIENVNGMKMRFTIKVDAYDFQSSAKAELWKEDGWREVHRIPGQQMRSCKSISYVARDVRPSAFDGDITELRSVSKGVLL